MTEAETAVLDAARAYAAAMATMQAHEPPYRGDEFERKCSTWRASQNTLLLAAQRLPQIAEGGGP